jgi:hypothetical protein
MNIHAIAARELGALSELLRGDSTLLETQTLPSSEQSSRSSTLRHVPAQSSGAVSPISVNQSTSSSLTVIEKLHARESISRFAGEFNHNRKLTKLIIPKVSTELVKLDNASVNIPPTFIGNRKPSNIASTSIMTNKHSNTTENTSPRKKSGGEIVEVDMTGFIAGNVDRINHILSGPLGRDLAVSASVFKNCNNAVILLTPKHKLCGVFSRRGSQYAKLFSLNISLPQSFHESDIAIRFIYKNDAFHEMTRRGVPDAVTLKLRRPNPTVRAA